VVLTAAAQVSGKLSSLPDEIKKALLAERLGEIKLPTYGMKLKQ
jgi:hypothetical protein